MRLVGYIHTGRFIIPLIAILVLLGILYGGGRSAPAEVYGVSAVLLFPVLALQTKLLMDAEPDVQRRMALSAIGSPVRELVASLIAAAIAALPFILLSLVLPWLFDAVTGANAGSALVKGPLVHLFLLLPALAVGAVSSRVITLTAGRGAAVLATGVVFAFVLGLHGSPVPWLAPPLIATTSAMAGDASASALLGLTVWALVWSAVAITGYGWFRRSRT
jgi:hypothetical protein